MTNTICIYHANCTDGFGSAYAVWLALGDQAEYFAASYGQEEPDVTGMDVIMVDFSYKRTILKKMLKVCRSMIILDHHKTAQDDLAFLPQLEKDVNESTNTKKFAALFDMDRSGAIIAWQYFHPTKLPPQLLLHIQDRDLWRFDLALTKEISATLFTLPMDFKVWHGLMETDLLELANEGKVIMRSTTKQINDFIIVASKHINLGGHYVPCLNAPFMWASEAGHIMAEEKPFSVTYFDHSKGRKYSLRSTDEGLDVSTIAKDYGGGGHRNAAGFELTLDELKEKGISTLR